MKKPRSLLILSLCCAINAVVAQSAATSSTNPIEKLDFLIGEWKGTGWMSTRQGKEYTDISEIAEYKLENSIIVVEGLGIKTDSITNTSKVVHNAFGIISFDPENSSYTMRAYKKEGVTDSQIEFIAGKTIRWKLLLPNGGQVRFTADYSVENTWMETGEFSRDGVNWIQILEMNLKRVK